MSASEMKSRMTKSADKPQWKSSVLIIDDIALVREGLRRLVGLQPDMEVCGEAYSVSDAMKKIKRLSPNIATVSLCLQEGSGLELLKWIADNMPQTKAIVLTHRSESEYGERVLRLGARGFVCKRSESNCIVEAIRKVEKGELYFSNELTNRILTRISLSSSVVEKTALDTLSDRELEVLTLIGQGKSTREIADCLLLSHHTIGTYRDRLKTKLNLKNATELLRFAMSLTGEQT